MDYEDYGGYSHEVLPPATGSVKENAEPREALMYEGAR